MSIRDLQLWLNHLFLYLLTTVIKDQILCSYTNVTNQVQIARITNIPNWYFERVVFPGQRLLFAALQSAQLEIHTGVRVSTILTDKIPCNRLASP